MQLDRESERNYELRDTENRNVVTAATVVQEEDSKVHQCLLVFSGFMAMFQVIGINSSYGVFQAYYSSEQSFLPPDTSQAAIAFVGTLGRIILV
jgi:hypothetical protein